jgi:putative SOS response-associated peptidase YedK
MMCGRFNFLTHQEELRERFGIRKFEFDVNPRYNVTPSQKIATIIQDQDVKLVGMRWGLIPFWAKELNSKYSMINARVETILEKRAYSKSFKKWRCLIPATGFYEWQKVGKKKKPMHIRFKSKELFAFAGIYNPWKAPTDTTVLSCSIVTTSPNKLLEPIHNRMPVILRKKDEATWINPELEDTKKLFGLLKPYLNRPLEAYEISTYVNKPGNEGPQCITPSNQGVLA